MPEVRENITVSNSDISPVMEEEKSENKTSIVKSVPVIYAGMSEKKLNEVLEKYGYEVNKSSLCVVKFKQDANTGGIIKQYYPISNFLPIITKQITYTNGRDENVFYDIGGILFDSKEELPTITISEEDSYQSYYLSNPKWKCKAILKPISSVDKNIKYISECVSKGFIEHCKVYSHTGFTKINGKSVYLYHGGVIGDVEDVCVDLSQDKLEQYCFTDKTFDKEEALKTSYSILDVAPPKITIPLLAITYLAPLSSLFNDNNINVDFVLWINGKTGTRKSSLSAVSLSHYGRFERNNFPSSFRDTTNSIEKKAFVLKDTLNCIDDFNPETVGNGKTGVAEKMLAMYGDRTGRDRMSSNGQSLKGAYKARGLCIVTGECLPDIAQSRIARTLIVDIKPNSIDLKKLRELQENTEKLAFAMKLFVSWIIKNETKIISEAKEMKKELEKRTDFTLSHGRLIETINAITIGFHLFLKFMQENNIITEEELKSKMELCSTVLIEIAKSQNQEIEAENPVIMFKEAIEQLYAAEKIQIIDYSSGYLSNSNSNLVGYVDEDKEMYYFLPDITYKEITRFYKEQGSKFPISKSALLKYLENEGYLYRTPKSDRRTIKKKAPNKNVVLPVIAIYKDKLELGTENSLSEFQELQEEFTKSITIKKAV